ncbi:DUF3592 domain-containing protein [Idiomarina sp. M1R2S28]|uniref:DUF3592 domain-containing protein n=1 Tax=Idiomarina rhizosphaerae TaxID=2961572 RepID=A0A9X2FUR3_9GAMM|nr:DUF3592 domain-containing protein [Idiomarina rhizosphaerae]MCP1338315.1 DUF3592 domain-containing protein [Idiomarina rhizosphaerae]
MFIGAFLWCVYLASIVITGLKTNDWPNVTGFIISSSEKRINHDKERYILEVSYKYTVEGETYESDKVANFNAMLTRSEKDKLLERYKAGEKVRVYFDPKKHSTAYLLKGLDEVVFILFAASLGLMLFSGLNLVRLIRSKLFGS